MKVFLKAVDFVSNENVCLSAVLLQKPLSDETDVLCLTVIIAVKAALYLLALAMFYRLYTEHTVDGLIPVSSCLRAKLSSS